MDEAKLELVRDWLTRASHDLDAARALSTPEKPLLDAAIYDFVLGLVPPAAEPH